MLRACCRVWRTPTPVRVYSTGPHGRRPAASRGDESSRTRIARPAALFGRQIRGRCRPSRGTRTVAGELACAAQKGGRRGTPKVRPGMRDSGVPEDSVRWEPPAPGPAPSSPSRSSSSPRPAAAKSAAPAGTKSTGCRAVDRARRARQERPSSRRSLPRPHRRRCHRSRLRPIRPPRPPHRSHGELGPIPHRLKNTQFVPRPATCRQCPTRVPLERSLVARTRGPTTLPSAEQADRAKHGAHLACVTSGEVRLTYEIQATLLRYRCCGTDAVGVLVRKRELCRATRGSRTGSSGSRRGTPSNASGERELCRTTRGSRTGSGSSGGGARSNAGGECGGRCV